MSEAFSIRLPEDQKTFLDNLAKATDRSRNNIISGAIAKMMENHNFVLARIKEGEADVAAGRVHDMGEVERRTQAVIDRAVKKR